MNHSPYPNNCCSNDVTSATTTTTTTTTTAPATATIRTTTTTKTKTTATPTKLYTYRISGPVAYQRIQPLLLQLRQQQSSSCSCSCSSCTDSTLNGDTKTTTGSFGSNDNNSNMTNNTSTCTVDNNDCEQEEKGETDHALSTTISNINWVEYDGGVSFQDAVDDNNNKNKKNCNSNNNTTDNDDDDDTSRQTMIMQPQQQQHQHQQQQRPDVLHFVWENTPSSWIKKLLSLSLDDDDDHDDDTDTDHHHYDNNNNNHNRRPIIQCYSHLPNGIYILDNKYMLYRLFAKSCPTTCNNNNNNNINNSKATTTTTTTTREYVCNYHPLTICTTYSFRGKSGYCKDFLHQVGITSNQQQEQQQQQQQQQKEKYLDLLEHDFTVTTFRTKDTQSSDDDTVHHSSNYHTRDNHGDSSNNNNNNNMWVIKDANSNGAGGIWVVGPKNYNNPSIMNQLYEQHVYIGQQYVSPMVLYRSKKFHVRVYVFITCDQRAFVHHLCFLHVANESFVYHLDNNNNYNGSNDNNACVIDSNTDTTTTTATTTDTSENYDDSIHITNCCVNSHDPTKFVGEICADLNQSKHQYRTHGSSSCTDHPPTRASTIIEQDHQMIIGLQPFASSIYASVERLVQVTAPFTQGGIQNHGFEYCGMDFILSYDPITYEPCAYLLEVNCPPSQDTATKLPHAEHVHNTVINDLLHLWVYPHILKDHNVEEKLGGWFCVYDGRKQQSQSMTTTTTTSIQHSKAALLNKIRWKLYERQQLRLEEQEKLQREKDQRQMMYNSSHTTEAATSTENNFVAVSATTTTKQDNTNNYFANYARKFYRYYTQQDTWSSSSFGGPPKIFFENAGGTQVPQQVVTYMNGSLSNRHRSKIGMESVQNAKYVLSNVLGASLSLYNFYFGSNASSLLQNVALWYINNHQISSGDEIIIQVENHIANVRPWMYLSEILDGIVVKWWDASSTSAMDDIVTLLSPKTRIIAISHASNVLGIVLSNKNIRDLRTIVDNKTSGYGQLVVDGVTYVPHRYADIDTYLIDWYVISCHKLFGPHLGILCQRKRCLPEKINNDCLQVGTTNYEACEGIRGLGQYFYDLSRFELSDNNKVMSTASSTYLPTNENENVTALPNKEQIMNVYRYIETTEERLIQFLKHGLQRSSKVRIIEPVPTNNDSNIVTPTGSDSSRLPIICFVHDTISNNEIVEKCYAENIICRNGTFLCTEQLQQRYIHQTNNSNTNDDGFVRFSLAHYNTTNEVQHLLRVLESMSGWM